MPEAFLEGLGRALDDHALALRRVWFDVCCLDGSEEIVQAAQHLARAESGPPVFVTLVDPAPEELRIPEPARCRVFRVPVRG